MAKEFEVIFGMESFFYLCRRNDLKARLFFECYLSYICR